MVWLYIKNYDEIIKSTTNEENLKVKKWILDCIEAALRSVEPSVAVKSALKIINNKLNIRGLSFDLDSFENIYVIGGGKASGAMAESIEQLLGNKITEGIVNVPEGTEGNYHTEIILINPASHPIPNENGLYGAKRMIEIAKKAGEKDLVIVLISGGGSALMPYPADNITLQEMQNITNLLLRSGATIEEINAVRKHISQFKGGQLAEAIYPATALTLIISDVVGDRLDTIASGPTAPDETTFKDAYNVLKRYNLLDKAPENIINRIKRGLSYEIPETPKSGNKIFKKIHNIIIANNRMALIGAMKEAVKLGLNAVILTSFLEGEAREVGTVLGSIVREIYNYNSVIKKPAMILAGGETTVTVRGQGKGGRNQELALSAAIKIRGLEGVGIASLGSDGIDGVTDAAGGIVDGTTIEKGLENGMNPLEYLDNNDTYSFLSKTGDLIITGPTGINVNDLIFICIS
ncbi:MAG: glycerate kinase type-2 family protein [Candidatus Njordarchaeales archaeon]